MQIPTIPQWAVNIFKHALSGFCLGFAATFVANPTGWQDISNEIYGAAVVGGYGAIKEVVNYVETLLSQPAGTNAASGVAAAPTVAKKKFTDGML